MTRRLLIGAMMVVAGIGQALASAPARQAPPRLVVLTVGDPVGEKMTYSMATITAKPGEKLKVRMLGMGKLPKTAMAHNFVLLQLGSDPKKFSDVAANAVATGYIPASLKHLILAQADFVGPGEQSEVVFTVPLKPGSYPYLCTFAGHYVAGMNGTLIVK